MFLRQPVDHGRYELVRAGLGVGQMVQVADRVRRLSDEVADGLAQLVAVAGESGSTVGEETRQRAADALQALRGQRSHRWRWLLLGAVVGFVAGVAVAGAARREQLPGVLEDAGREFAETVREKATPVQDAATKARDTARDKLPGSRPGSDAEPGGTSGDDTESRQ